MSVQDLIDSDPTMYLSYRIGTLKSRKIMLENPSSPLTPAGEMELSCTLETLETLEHVRSLLLNLRLDK